MILPYCPKDETGAIVRRATGRKAMSHAFEKPLTTGRDTMSDRLRVPAVDRLQVEGISGATLVPLSVAGDESVVADMVDADAHSPSMPR